jgi:serine protease Do
MEEFVNVFGIGASRPRLGISVDAGQGGGMDAEGALVTDVLRDGPADEAGIREGDLITRIDGQSLFESIGAEAEADFDLDSSMPVQRLLALARELEPGSEVEIEYLREGRTQTTMLEAEDLSDSWGENFAVAPGWDAERFQEQLRTLTEGARSLSIRRAPSGGNSWGRSLYIGGDRPDVHVLGGGGSPFMWGVNGLGLELVEINPGLGEYFGAESGVLVADVDRGSGLGLEAGDVVIRIGDRPVDSPERFRRIVGSYAEEEDITFHILRNGAETAVTGRLRY